MAFDEESRSAKAAIKASPLGPFLARLKAGAAGPRSGLSLLAMFAVGRLPFRGLRTFLARHLLGLRLDSGSILYRWRDLRHPAGIEIGAGSVIGFWVTLDGREGITIGENVN